MTRYGSATASVDTVSHSRQVQASASRPAVLQPVGVGHGPAPTALFKHPARREASSPVEIAVRARIPGEHRTVREVSSLRSGRTPGSTRPRVPSRDRTGRAADGSRETRPDNLLISLDP